uniref:Uncharacterized protein n=1 Tax=Catharus ustulatus TaxID=91951 RepID=A0A8C3TZY8_CATUS
MSKDTLQPESVEGHSQKEPGLDMGGQGPRARSGAVTTLHHSINSRKHWGSNRPPGPSSTTQGVPTCPAKPPAAAHKCPKSLKWGKPQPALLRELPLREHRGTAQPANPKSKVLHFTSGAPGPINPAVREKP